MASHNGRIHIVRREYDNSCAGQTVTLAGHFDDLAATIALATSGLFEDYISYQRPGRRWFAGSSQAEVVMHHWLMTYGCEGQIEEAPREPRPFRQLGRAVTQILRPGQRAFGYLAFEIAHLAHGSSSVRSHSPLAHFIVPQIEVRWTGDEAMVTSAQPALLDAVVDILRTAMPLIPPRTISLELTNAVQRRRYEESVAGVIKAIRDGRLRKAIVSRRVDVPFAVDLPRSYAVGLRQNTPARSFLMQLGERRCAGFSPETLAEIGKTGDVITQPLAGTRPLMHQAAEDLRLREELEWNVKECYEHIISVRQAVDELRSVCTPNSVMVDGLLSVKKRGTVQHLGSTVIGQLRTGKDAWDAVEALFPAVTVSGISKRTALEMIVATEEDQRELYAGAICIVDSSGALDSAVVLRSIFQQPEGRTWLRAGAGIVADSQPSLEYNETTNKLRSVAGCLVQANELKPPVTMATGRDHRDFQ